METVSQQLVFDKKSKGISVFELGQNGETTQLARRKKRQLQRTEEGCLILNERNLSLLCEIDGLYQYPEMNKKLYLHYKVIDRLEGLEKYVNLKTLYLQNNVIRKIQNLGHLAQLQNLFLQNNMIKKMEGLEKLKELKILNLANNNLFLVEGLDNCHLLQNLTLTRNYLSDFASLQHLGHCTTQLTSIDLSDNKIIADEKLFDLIPQVKCLYLSGNPLVRQTKHYRRVVVGKLTNLMYLDQRGVDSQERMVSQAWIAEGQAGFKAAREKIVALRKQKKQDQRDEIMKNIDVHRRNKINVFEGNIIDSQKQIQKLRDYMKDPNNYDQIYFYEYRIAELMQKIRQNQDFIDGIYKRMGLEPPPPVYSIQLDEIKKEGEQDVVETAQSSSNVAVQEQKSEQNSGGRCQEVAGQRDSQDKESRIAESLDVQSKEVQTRSGLDELD